MCVCAQTEGAGQEEHPGGGPTSENAKNRPQIKQKSDLNCAPIGAPPAQTDFLMHP